ncbi:zinc ribbon domain-containing protein [Candidatus Xianfuyuplasma coldseepsis]|uniref:Zinc ribbon domain-containing protein n=1 Tax=Candidatus Xianfuyuplasma coldseepsis TaxID=2782163 RepID=A0A7L7KRR0_9MOLU|nr:zinc ribbon domain-containing protein [Xianfuyuplasma coldseepsis]QMS85099.1 zinc ribbon domain-containing protein [Xianfuyuplasma coldseepsis]
MKCIKCGTENIESNKFCSNCGSKLGKMECASCHNSLTVDVKFCGNCGSENPFYTLPKIEDMTPPREAKKVRDRNFLRTMKKHKQLILLILIALLSTVAFASSFGGISKTNYGEWDFSGSDAEFVDFSFNQNAIQLYRGYFSAVFLSSQNEMNDYQSEIDDNYYESLDDFGDVISAREFRKLYSNLDLFGYSMSNSLSLENTFTSSIEYFIVVVLLIITQLLTLIIIGIAVVRYLNGKDLIVLRKLFIVGFIIGLNLAFFLPNIMSQTNAGGGLVTYLIFMLLGFVVLHIVLLRNRQQIQIVKSFKYIFDIVLIIVIFLIASGNLIRVGYEESSTKKIWGSFRIEELTNLMNVYDPDFVYSTDSDYYNWYSTYLEDPDLTSSDQKELAKLTDYSYLFAYRIFDSNEGQDIFIGIAISIGILVMLVTSSLFYTVVVATTNKTSIVSIGLRITLVILFITLLVLSIIASSMINTTFDRVDEPFIARMSIGLIFGIILSIISLILSAITPGSRKHLEV